jgi:hypothetical protein
MRSTCLCTSLARFAAAARSWGVRLTRRANRSLSVLRYLKQVASQYMGGVVSSLTVVVLLPMYLEAVLFDAQFIVLDLHVQDAD